MDSVPADTTVSTYQLSPRKPQMSSHSGDMSHNAAVQKGPQRTAPMAQVVAGASVAMLALGYFLMFSIQTHIIITCMLGGVLGLMYTGVLLVKTNGLMSYLPASAVDQLMNERLVDIIQEPVLNPKVALNVLSLFVTELTNDEKQRVLDRLPAETAKVFGTYGLINVMPAKVRALLLPPELRDHSAFVSTSMSSNALIQAPGGAAANGHTSYNNNIVPASSSHTSALTTISRDSNAVQLRPVAYTCAERDADPELVPIKEDFARFTKRAVHSYISAVVGSTFGEKAAHTLKAGLPDTQTVQQAGVAISVSSVLLFALNKNVREFARGAGMIALTTTGFVAATYSLYTIINSLDVRRRQKKAGVPVQKGHVWQHREAYMSTVAFGLWLLYLKKAVPRMQ